MYIVDVKCAIRAIVCLAYTLVNLNLVVVSMGMHQNTITVQKSIRSGKVLSYVVRLISETVLNYRCVCV